MVISNYTTIITKDVDRIEALGDIPSWVTKKKIFP